jgi:3-oxoacyl-[acyl-carrier-protein] synthase II
MVTPRIFITGLGVVSPIGIGWRAFTDSILQNRDGFKSLPHVKEGSVQPMDGYTIGGWADDFDPKMFVRPRKSLKVMCREIQTAFAASMMSLEDAGMNPEEIGPSIPRDRLATVFGCEILYGPWEYADALREAWKNGNPVDIVAFGSAALKHISPLWLLKYLPNMPACQVGISIGATGANNTITNGDISGPSALAEAASYLRRGIADVVVAGASGTRANETRLVYRGDSPLATKVPSAGSNDLSGSTSVSGSTSASDAKSTSDNASSDGVMVGEAAVAMIVETRESCEKRGIACEVEFVGVAQRFVPSESLLATLSNDAVNNRGSRQAIELAISGVLENSNVSSEKIGCVVRHFSGDPPMDLAENAAIDKFVSLDTPRVAPMRLMGYSGAASGAIGIATAVGLIRRREMINDDRPYVLSIAHTTQGAATATLLRRYSD